MNLEKAEILENWRSVKSFKDKEVKEKTLKQVFNLTTNAPTAFNLQTYRFIVLDSQEAMKKAVESANPVNGWIRYADKIVVLIGDEEIDVNSEQVLKEKIENDEIDQEKAENLKEMYKSYKNRDQEFIEKWLTRNTVIPGTFFMLACRSKGIGVCPVRGFKQDNLSERLNLKESEKPILIYPIGYPNEFEDRHWRRNGEEIYNIR